MKIEISRAKHNQDCQYLVRVKRLFRKIREHEFTTYTGVLKILYNKYNVQLVMDGDFFWSNTKNGNIIILK